MPEIMVDKDRKGLQEVLELVRLSRDFEGFLQLVGAHGSFAILPFSFYSA